MIHSFTQLIIAVCVADMYHSLQLSLYSLNGKLQFNRIVCLQYFSHQLVRVHVK